MNLLGEKIAEEENDPAIQGWQGEVYRGELGGRGGVVA